MIKVIELYSGTPGSGKSLHVADKIYWWLHAGKKVVCNFMINLGAVWKKPPQVPNFHYLDNEKMTPDLLIWISNNWFESHKFKEEQILLVIDEAQLIFNAREWSKKGRSDWLSFFTQHRKLGYHVILVAQFDRMIDRQIRSLFEYEIVHRKLSNFGLKGKLLSLFMGGNMHVAVKVWYPMNEKVGSEFFRARRKIYRLYDSYGTFAITE